MFPSPHVRPAGHLGLVPGTSYQQELMHLTICKVPLLAFESKETWPHLFEPIGDTSVVQSQGRLLPPLQVFGPHGGLCWLQTQVHGWRSLPFGSFFPVAIASHSRHAQQPARVGARGESPGRGAANLSPEKQLRAHATGQGGCFPWRLDPRKQVRGMHVG